MRSYDLNTVQFIFVVGDVDRGGAVMRNRRYSFRERFFGRVE